MRVNHVRNYIDEQSLSMGLITSAVSKLTRVGSLNVSSNRIETRRTALEEAWSNFSLKHNAILIAMRKLESRDKRTILKLPYFQENFFEETQEGYLEAVELMKSMMDRIRKDTRSPSINAGSQASSFPSSFNSGPRLPQLNLPTFDGSHSEWMQFKDLFESMVISNSNLSPVWKLHYLKQSLTGNASPLLKNTLLTNDNFQKAWDSLVSFYENKRLLVNSALQSLVSLKRMSKESSSELETLYTSSTQIYRSLETLGRPVSSWDDILVFLIAQKLEPETVKAWEQHLGSSQEPPSWKQFIDFLLSRLLTLKAVEKSRRHGGHSGQQPVKAHFVSDAQNAQIKCAICSGEHYTAKCPEYIDKVVKDKVELIKKHRLCFNCLRAHRVANCQSTRRCIKCGKTHHSSIHGSNESTKPKATSDENSSVQVNLASSYHNSSPVQTLLATIQLIVSSENGVNIKARAMVDPGSQISFISEKLVQQLQVSRQNSSLPLLGIGAVKAGRTRGLVSVNLKPYFKSSTEYKIAAHVLPKLTSRLLTVSTDNNNWKHLENLQLADPEFYSSGEIDIIIGADHYGLILEQGLRQGSTTSPTAQATIFGWILFGPSRSETSEVQIYHTSIDEELFEVLQRFWKWDEMPSISTPSLSAEDQECEDHFKAMHSRKADGRYIVKLPLKKSPTLLGDSKSVALRMFSRLSTRMKTNPKFHQAYSDFLNEYESLDHMKLANDSTSAAQQTVYYLPHHGVIRESSVTTKLRVVFNASSKTSTGLSLNDIVHTGAKLQTELFDVLIWFRHFQFAFTADMEKMYRQIEVHPQDWNLQRILWSKKDNEIVPFQLTTVTYGIACAPFLALRTVQQLIEDERANFPLAESTLKRGRYVDDIFGGADSLTEAQLLVQQVNGLCLAGGFPLKKWASNHSITLQHLPTDIQLFPTSIAIDPHATVHTLGMSWNPSSDMFHFNWTTPPPVKITKRTTLSTIAKLFDPLGFLAPIIISGKIFIQDLWSLKLGWDDHLPSHLADKWNKFQQNLEELNSLSFPRWFGTTSQTPIEIHGFCDASQHALSAAVYIKSSDQNREIQTALVCAKTKVAPLKKLTIPRLELSSAVLLIKLIKHLIKILNFENYPIHLWTDSAISYTWINNHPSRWKEFIQNRVCYIQEAVPSAKWYFIPGKENPADFATRGFTPTQLSQCPTWWTGPTWLRENPDSWPRNFDENVPKKDLEERPISTNVATSTSSDPEWDLLKKYSSLHKLIRITALCKRFILRLKKQADSIRQTPLTIQELNEAKYFWAKKTQETSFFKERNLLLKGENLPSNHHLVRLTPFLDDQQLLRLGGRLKEAFLPFNAKHPVILPRESTFTQLVILDAHQRTLHGGTQDTLSFIRNDFWIIGGRVPISSTVWKCVICARYRKKRSQQLMGQLPADRVTPSRPFLHSGVDYAGPLLLKTWKGRAARTYKAYIALFVCHATSAIHLEIVTDYSSDAFIAAYKRFTARRGICSTLRSDCGTTLKGADSQLRDMFTSSSNEIGKLASLLANDGTQWIFNPPAAPHFGGKWEAGVKSVKQHLRRVIGTHSLTYEEMSTFLLQVEVVLNSRPLSPLTEDPDDLNVLTPGHFLIGSALTVIPEPELENVKLSRLSRWQLLRQMTDSFWTKWSKECLQRYQTVYKWNQPMESIRKDSLVLVIDERYPPAKWPLGRILEVHPGKDGRTRVVTVKTQTSTFKRPITKISLLPVNDTCI